MHYYTVVHIKKYQFNGRTFILSTSTPLKKSFFKSSIRFLFWSFLWDPKIRRCTQYLIENFGTRKNGESIKSKLCTMRCLLPDWLSTDCSVSSLNIIQPNPSCLAIKSHWRNCHEIIFNEMHKWYTPFMKHLICNWRQRTYLCIQVFFSNHFLL